VAFEFSEVTFTKSELLALPTASLKFLVASCIAANGIAVFQRIIIQTLHSTPSHEIIKTYNIINNQVLVRHLAMAILSYNKVVAESASQIEDLGLRREVEQITAATKASPSFNLALQLRNEMTGHYNVAGIDDRLGGFSDDHAFSMFLHEMTGNSLYPIGEEIGHFSRHDSFATIDALLDWVIEASGSLLSLQQRVFAHLVEKRFPRKRIMKRKVPVEAALAWSPEQRSALLLRPNK
jgi:hypothetical protein